jgi:ribosomal protein S8
MLVETFPKTAQYLKEIDIDMYLKSISQSKKYDLFFIEPEKTRKSITTLGCFPLVCDGECLGTLSLYVGYNYNFHSEACNFVEAVARILANAIKSIESYRLKKAPAAQVDAPAAQVDEMLTRIQESSLKEDPIVLVPATSTTVSLAKKMKEMGFIANFNEEKVREHVILKIYLNQKKDEQDSSVESWEERYNLLVSKSQFDNLDIPEKLEEHLQDLEHEDSAIRCKAILSLRDYFGHT